MAKITKTYQANITISYDDENVDIEYIASGYKNWLSDTIADDNVWGDGSVEVNLESWKEVE